MKMKFNRITMSLISALFVFALISCNMEMPESVRVKSNPGLYLSLGSPFAGSNMSFSEYLSEDGLKEQLGGESGNIDLLVWDEYPDQNVQAYRVRYPVADINIDLTEYVESMDVASNLDSASGAWIPGTGSEIDIPLPLDSMSFAHDVTNVTISVTLKFEQSYTAPAADVTGSDTVPAGVAVTFKGPVFGGNVNGTPSDSPPNKWSSSQIATFNPATDIISMGVTVPAGYWFSPQLGFEWTSADISIGAEGKQTGSYKLDFTSFSEFMGEGVSFKKISGYMYKETVGSNTFTANTTTSLTWQGGSPVPVTPNGALTDWKNSFTQPNNNEIDLTNLFASPLTFDYTLELSEATINSSETGTNTGKISVDMVILLPLEFTLDDSLKSDIKDSKNNSYRKLELEMLQGIGKSEGDLLGRGSGEENMFKDMKEVSLIFSDYINEAIDGLSFGYKLTDTSGWKVLDAQALKSGAVITLNEIPNPFTPEFQLLVSDSAILKILKREKDDEGNYKEANIDLKIAVEAKTDLDYPVKF
jgi:hypothetical protein